MYGYGKRILVIDNVADIRYFTCVALSNAGYNVYSAADCSEGLQEMGKRRYDTVLIDYDVLSTDGGEFLHRAHASWPKTPIILLSDVDRVTELICPVKGISAYLSKPFDVPTFLDVIAHVTSNQSAGTEVYTNVRISPADSLTRSHYS